MDQNIQAILDFWFVDTTPQQWWQKDIEFDQLIQEKFGHLHQQAVQCELYKWRQTATGSLAEIIILDQFSRNIYRDTPQSFSADTMALSLAQQAIAHKLDQKLDPEHRLFLYMPFMHSESQQIHQVAVELFTELGLDQNLHYELQHKAIIDRFGRYPHRNKILGRQSTSEELQFLAEPNSSF